MSSGGGGGRAQGAVVAVLRRAVAVLAVAAAAAAVVAVLAVAVLAAAAGVAVLAVAAAAAAAVVVSASGRESVRPRGDTGQPARGVNHRPSGVGRSTLSRGSCGRSLGLIAAAMLSSPASRPCLARCDAWAMSPCSSPSAPRTSPRPPASTLPTDVLPPASWTSTYGSLDPLRSAAISSAAATTRTWVRARVRARVQVRVRLTDADAARDAPLRE